MNLHDLNMKRFYIAVNMLLPLSAYAQNISFTFGENKLDTERLQSCLQRSSCSEIANTIFEGMICQCDPECTKYGDCCIDAIEMPSKRSLPQTCMKFGNNIYQGLYMVNTCPTNYEGPEEIRHMCLNDDISDIAKSAPVTDFVNRQIYLNRYCAICNEVPFLFLKAWLISTCRVENSTVANFSSADVIYRSTEKKWGYELNGQFHPCRFVFEKPPSVPGIGRSCRLGYVSSCPNTWNETDYWNACQSYTAVVKDSHNTLYKNPHCAICNGVALSDIECLMSDGTDFSFTFITGRLDINKAFGANRMFNWAHRSPALLCPEDHRYDRSFGRCRAIVCIFPGYSVKDGRCVKV